MTLVAAVTAISPAQAGLKARLRVNSENVAVKNALEREFRDVLGDVIDLTIVNDGSPVDVVLLVNGVDAAPGLVAFSTTVIDMDSYLMAARDTVREISIDKLKETLRARGVSGTVAYSVVSTCSVAGLHESVRSVVRGFNASSLTDIRNALTQYGALSSEPKIPGSGEAVANANTRISADVHPIIGQ
jgi:hypothetical protein